MTRFFNTTGPCDPQRHYMLPPSDRLIGAQLNRYIQDELYWVLHAPRQTGKTTFLQNWMREINAGNDAIACYVNIERCQGLGDIERAMPAACEAIREFSRKALHEEYVPQIPSTSPASMLSEMLTNWAEIVAPKPLIVLFDEVDVLRDQSMISFLRQLRSGFATRGVGKFPVSAALVGMRDLRDYLIHSKDGVAINPGSPFNIKQDSVSLNNFSRTDVAKLLTLHTDETGQQFEPASIELVYELTIGQPWLVNAMAQKCVWNLAPQESREPVSVDHVRRAKELLIRDRATHLDSLAERLKDAQVRRVIEAVMIGKTDSTIGRADRDVELCTDLGLLRWDDGLRIANPIYQEIITRELSQNYQDNVPSPEFAWRRPDGTLDMISLLKNFQAFWRRNSDTWEQKADYTEAFPHLLLMAFLQRIINGGGRIDREYAAGRGRIDLSIEFGGAWSIIEIKLVHPQDGREITIENGIKQIAAYRDRIDPRADAFLIVFDRRPEARGRSWEERLTWETFPSPALYGQSDGTITVIGA
ncbi:MAG: AAA-like domain-containing protein [Candidatus Riflebacteria bacterium]|nr:AAA-like domain-containing protein [Candidatus Riflebacteria bacterium]